jgi:hypothetical protein
MMLDAILVSLRQAWGDVNTTIVTLGPRLVAALVVVVAGWLVARSVSWLTTRLIARLPMDRVAGRTAFADALRLAELPPAGRLVPRVAFWLVWIAFLAQALGLLEVPGFEHARAEFVDFVGRLVRAVVLLLIGVLIANVLWRATLLAAYNAGLPSARLMAASLRVLVLAVSVLTALAHVGIPMVIVLTAFSIAFGALMLGLALAFGLGGRDAARDFIARHGEAPKQADREGRSHL